MTARQIDGPGDGMYVTTEVAAGWLGVSVATFRHLCGMDPNEMTPPGVAEWMRPVNMAAGKKAAYRWLWSDVYCLGHILSRRQTLAADLPEGGEVP
jgi:hypothetical protein